MAQDLLASSQDFQDRLSMDQDLWASFLGDWVGIFKAFQDRLKIWFSFKNISESFGDFSGSVEDLSGSFGTFSGFSGYLWDVLASVRDFSQSSECNFWKESHKDQSRIIFDDLSA